MYQEYLNKKRRSIGSCSNNNKDEDLVESYIEDFDRDMKFNLVMYIRDVEDLMERVDQVWLKVRRNEETSITATAVTVMAIEFVEKLTSQLT